MHKITNRYPALRFTPHDCFVYSPAQQTVFYNKDQVASDHGQLALLHEIGHAHLGHQAYRYDIGLLNMEVAAWAFARQAAGELDIAVDEQHIQSCLESYRTWLYKRSRCPECQSHGVQTARGRYKCFVCHQSWRVSRNLTLQPRRLSATA